MTSHRSFDGGQRELRCQVAMEAQYVIYVDSIPKARCGLRSDPKSGTFLGWFLKQLRNCSFAIPNGLTCMFETTSFCLADGCRSKTDWSLEVGRVSRKGCPRLELNGALC